MQKFILRTDFTYYYILETISWQPKDDSMLVSKITPTDIMKSFIRFKTRKELLPWYGTIRQQTPGMELSGSDTKLPEFFLSNEMTLYVGTFHCY